MKYSKPELLAVETALAAIRGGKVMSDFDGEDLTRRPRLTKLTSRQFDRTLCRGACVTAERR